MFLQKIFPYSSHQKTPKLIPTTTPTVPEINSKTSNSVIRKLTKQEITKRKKNGISEMKKKKNKPSINIH